jgi:hypothetical protein
MARFRTLVGYTLLKKGYRFSRPQPGCHQPNSLCPGIIKLFPPGESLVGDIPAGDGKTANLLLQCRYGYGRILNSGWQYL